MIDWLDLAANAIWVFGCALALAALSYARWAAHERGERLRVYLGRPRTMLVFDLSGALFCMGLAFTSQAAWQVVAWLALMVLFAWQARRDWLAARTDH